MSTRPAFAISLYVTGRTAVVVGDHQGARERARALRAAGAQVIEVASAGYGPEVCEGAFVVIAQSDDPALDGRVAADARAAGCLCYAHDQPAVSDFAMPAVARRGPLAVTISTDAVAPALARRLRRELQAALDRAGQALDRLIADMAAARAALPAGDARRRRLSALVRRLRLRGRLDVGEDAGEAEENEPGPPESEQGPV